MQWVALVTALFSFAKAFLKYLEHRDERALATKEKIERLREFKRAMDMAKEGNTNEIETMFTMLVPSNSGKLPNDTN